MRKKQLLILSILILLPAAVSPAIGNGLSSQKARPFVGQDLHLSGRQFISHQSGPDEHILVFRDGFSMSIGANQFSSDRAVVWLESAAAESRGRVRVDVNARVYLTGNLSAEKTEGAGTVDLSQTVVEQGRSLVIRFGVSGEIFITADKGQLSDPRRLELYKKGFAAVRPVEPEFVIQPGAVVPALPAKQPERPLKQEVVAAKPSRPEAIKKKFEHKKVPPEPPKAAAEPEAEEPGFVYPVNIAPVGKIMPKIESSKTADGIDIATVLGRFYLWQKQDEKGGLLELQADNAVVFYSGQEFQTGKERTDAEGVLAEGAVQAIYMSGDVVMTEGRRTIRADQIYYDFHRKKAVAVDAVMRNFDVSRGIPIYVRAAKLRQVAENKFAGEDITLTSSEFYLPQISLTASSVIITDTTTIDAQQERVSDSSYDAQMEDVRMKMGESTVFYWPFIRSNLQRPDVPIKSVRVGNDSTWGTSIETRWYLSRLLGLQEPEGVDSILALDYFDKRGLGAGVEIDYTKENYYGRILGYVIKDSGEDKLGRHDSRRNLKADRDFRGRFSWRHRHFLPYNWQLTASVGYASDENFIEGYYRGEFNVGKEETYVHMKRLEDNWAVSLLGKSRINDFADELEELPSLEFHLAGQSLFDDEFTLYSDTQISRLRQKIGKDHTIAISNEEFAFASHRTELDMPVWAAPFKIVPFVAATFGYDDRSGFTRTLVDGSDTGGFGEDCIWFGEAGVRVTSQYWKVYPNVKSRLWDLNQLRHIIKPQLAAVAYKESDSVVEQLDTLNFAVSQRLQTKRGPIGERRTIDWMRLDMDITWVDDSAGVSDSEPGPDKFIWSRPIVPLRVLSAPEIFSGDLINELHRFEMFGPRRNYIGADYIWRLSETSAILSDLNFDMQSGVVQQCSVGFSRLVWPNLQFYVGSRYLRRIEIFDEKGSNAFTFAATYVLDPRYTLVFSQQYDFDYGANIRSDITLIRRYHRIYCGFTYSADESLNEQRIVFSIWPQGIRELAIGQRKFVGLGGSAGY